MSKKYDIRTFTIEQMKELIYNGDDSHRNQIRVTNDGYIFLSQDIVGSVDIDDIRYRMETFIPGNNYVGPSAIEDNSFIRSLHMMFTKAWNEDYEHDFLNEFFMPLSFDN